MIRVVLDTSVLVSAVISSDGPNAQVLELIISGKARPFVTAAVMEEYGRVFEYSRLQHLDKRRVIKVCRLIDAIAVKVKSGGHLRISSHEDDNRIYECAAAAKAHYIVTENTRHFKRSHGYTKIITARQLLRLLEAGKA